MEYSLFNKITKKELFLVIILPFFILLLCLKGTTGNFENIEGNTEYQQRFELSGHPFEFSRTRSLFLTTLSIVQFRQFNIPEERYAFGGNDMGTINQMFFSWAPPGSAIVGAFFYNIFSHFNLGQFGAYLSIVFVSIANVFLIYKLVLLFLSKNKKTALLSGYLYLFANISFVYSITYFQHQYTIFFLCLLLFGIWKTKREQKVSEIWSYLIPSVYGVSVFFDYPNLILLSPLLFAWFLLSFELPKKESKKIILRSFFIIVLWISLLLQFNQKNFGNPFQMINTLPRPYQATLENFDEIKKIKNNPINIFKSEHITEGLYTYSLDPNRGLFFFTPILLLGILSFSTIKKRHPRFLYLSIIIIFSNLFLYASFSVPSGGWSFGPRYLLPVTLILSIYTALWIEGTTYKQKLFVFPLLLLSIGNNLAGALSTLTIPETVDTTYYGIKNLEFILNNVSGSFVYKTFFSHTPLIYYFIALFLLLLMIFIYLLLKQKGKN